ncbi:ABC transporter ATP-binding protein [Raineyella sp. LH-20]|uniref:ABC transporter ATP-binding protein n=1 Tax=Raineyella sp. LH-20 TaxID=3081204 RepID=UPI002953E781|nr:ABC transporter ATP-binding protein [Raineyella sp. LH-20]WOP20114.1 ABC transporter ATP-binding protein [Raineyella sp. LH-20]
MGSSAEPVSERSTVAKLRAVLTLVPWRMRWPLILMAFVSVISALMDMLAVVAMAPLMQILTTPQGLPPVVELYLVPIAHTSDRKILLLYTTLFVGLMFIFKNVTMIAMRWWSIGEMSRAAAAASAEMLRRYVHASYLTHRRRMKADIIQTVTGSITSALSGILLNVIGMITDIVTSVVLLGTLVVLAPASSAVAVVVFGGAALLMVRVIKPHALRYGLQALTLNTQMWAALNPAIEGFRESRIFGREDMFADRFADNRLAYVHPARVQQVLGELPRYLMEIVMIAGVLIIGILMFGAHPEAEALGLLAVFAAASIRIAPALNRVVAAVNGVRANRSALDRVVEQMDELASAESQTPQEASHDMPLPSGDIVVTDVGFCYPDSSTPVLSGVSVTIHQGHTVALVGSSGAGKTTFADLLLTLFHPTEGTITVNGTNISQHPRAWRRTVAAVSQKVYLWDATVRDLITFGEPSADIDPGALQRAIHQAQLQDLLDAMPDGLDTFVGEGGARISGGQAQRIGIARALYFRPEVLVLDEATSALDNETEHEITATLEALHGTMTVIVVAHRLSTVRNADEILFFSGGRLADRGTMSSLRETNAEFARLVELGQLV